MTPERKKHALYRNGISYFGFLVMVGAAFLIIGALVFEAFSARPNPYVGMATYLFLPGVFFGGLVIFLWGMRRESVRRRKTGRVDAMPYPRVDLNDPVHRRRFAYILFGGGLIAIVLAFTAYKGFQFTESVQFCGQTCHTVMKPEYVTYKNSPHARVKCVECHVGSGASWYVKSKISGVRQIFAVIFDTYPRPIPTPIHDLRPARDTCEHCHWPKKFFGAQLVQKPYFRLDEKNTPEQISLLVKTGGGDPKVGTNAGIHWHMVTGNKVWYTPIDEKRQRIGRVRVKHPDGRTIVYERPDLPPPAKNAQPERLMDCIDCHNRPAHRYESPDVAVDRALAAHLIPRDLPWIKKVAYEALLKRYATAEEAHQGLRATISKFYREHYPRLIKGNEAKLEQAIKEVIAIHDRNVFPEMKVDWKTHAHNISHKRWRGCFRCHDGKHRTKDGKVLTRECTTCHTMPQRGPLKPLGMTAPNSKVDWHILKLKGRHWSLTCDRCHAVGTSPNGECLSCHELKTGAHAMKGVVVCSTCHRSTGNAKDLVACTTCHTQLKGLHTEPKNQGVPCQTCHKPHTWKIAKK